MIDFKNATFFKLAPIPNAQMQNILAPILLQSEIVLCCFKGIRDCVAFTSKRIIAVNVQGVSGKKKDFTSLPYRNIQAFSVETSGTFDNDCELDLWFSGLGNVRLEFIKTMDITEIGRLISEKVL